MSATVSDVIKKLGDSQALLCPCFFLALKEAWKDINESIFFSNWPYMNVFAPRIPINICLELACRHGWDGIQYAECITIAASPR